MMAAVEHQADVRSTSHEGPSLLPDVQTKPPVSLSKSQNAQFFCELDIFAFDQVVRRERRKVFHGEKRHVEHSAVSRSLGHGILSRTIEQIKNLILS